jgi:tetratricopeptide (TPR) repeat protein
MSRFGKIAILPVLVSMSMASSATAQAPDCPVDRQTPADVIQAYLALQNGMNAPAVDVAQNQVRQAVRRLSTAQPGAANQTGRTMLLGMHYALWLNLDGSQRMTKRGTVGLDKDIDGTIDLVKAVDSIFKIIETKEPLCVAELANMRHVAWWRNTLNEAIRLMSVDSIDAAALKARETMILASDMPYAHLILANQAVKNELPDTAIKYYGDAAAESRRMIAAGDTTQKGNLASALYESAQVAIAAAEVPKHSPTPAKKAEFLATAKKLLDEMTQLGETQAKFARTGLVRIAIISGDSAAIRAMFDDQIANPDTYTASQIIQSGVSAMEAKLTTTAIKLFDIAVAKNPNHRDVLYNSALLYLDPKNNPNWEKGLGLVQRLLAVDPNGRENYRLAQIAFTGVRNTLVKQGQDMGARGSALKPTDVVPRKAIQDSIDAIGKTAGQLIDSLVMATTKYDSLPARVLFNEYSPSAARVVLGGTITNATDATKTWTIKIEFLDKAGTVVDTQEKAVTVESKKSTSFTVTSTSPNSGTVTGFRYAELK